MKNLFILFIAIVPFFASAQKTHTVGPKETLFSIGRLYSVHPRELASYNGIPFETGLTIGQVIKIPAKKTMAPLGEVPAVAPTVVKKDPVKTETAKAEPVKAVVAEKKPTKTGAAVYHTVQKKEGLYGISKRYNVTIDDIKKWNNLGGDALSEGTNLIVGYGGKVNAQPVAETVPEKKEATAVKVPEKKEPIAEAVKQSTRNVSEPQLKQLNGNFNGGVFKSLYSEQVAGQTVSEDKGTAGIFKSTSGWEDGKYYCLNNEAPSGSIIKITNPATQKSVYAKVLDLIPELKKNENLVICISNAAAAELGAGANNFECVLNF